MREIVEGIPPEDLRRLVEEIQDAPVVDYSPKHGGVCPICGAARCRVYTSSPWVGSVKERFHKCRACGMRFKSIETD